MKNLLTIVLLLASVSVNAATTTIGVAKISHYIQTVNGYDFDWNETNVFVDVEVANRLHVGAFDNSFGDIAPYGSLDVVSTKVAGADVVASVGVAYYESNVVSVSKDGKDYTYAVELPNMGIDGLLPIANINISKTYGSITVGATIAPVYSGSYVSISF